MVWVALEAARIILVLIISFVGFCFLGMASLAWDSVVAAHDLVSAVLAGLYGAGATFSFYFSLRLLVDVSFRPRSRYGHSWFAEFHEAAPEYPYYFYVSRSDGGVVLTGDREGSAPWYVDGVRVDGGRIVVDLRDEVGRVMKDIPAHPVGMVGYFEEEEHERKWKT